jgi:histidinol-phosphate aminotransferase
VLFRSKELGWLKPYPSQANFILCSLSYRSESSIPCHSEGARRPKNLATGKLREESRAKDIWQGLRQKGIFVRYFDTPRLRDCLRISVGRPEDTDALIEALRALSVIATLSAMKRKQS